MNADCFLSRRSDSKMAAFYLHFGLSFCYFFEFEIRRQQKIMSKIETEWKGPTPEIHTVNFTPQFPFKEVSGKLSSASIKRSVGRTYTS